MISRPIQIAGVLAVAAALLGAGCATAPAEPRRIGVVYVFHGGNDASGKRSSWESTLQIFGYDPNSVVYRNVMWNADAWPRILGFGNAPKELGKYAFEYERIGGTDPAQRLTLAHYETLKTELEFREAELGVDFQVDYASWLSDDPAHLVYPRAIYRPGVAGGAPMRYCGSAGDGGIAPDNTWPGCSPNRYDVDGTIERLLAAGVTEIIMVDLTTSGVRFCKTFDVINTARLVTAAFRERSGRTVPVRWVNDPNDLMTRSYPADDPPWTLSLGAAKHDRRVPIAGSPNPVAADAELAMLHAEGIEARSAPGVDWAATGVLLVNHATREDNESFDPKINDTLVLNANIKRLLLERHRALQADNVVGGWFGRKTENPLVTPRAPAFNKRERTREMRGENLGDAWLYETDELPGGDMGYLYWDALDRLRRNGVRHIVVAFPQIMVDSVLNLVEVPNQVAKEIGYKTWLDFERKDFGKYPQLGHPFADYWGIWVDRMCPVTPGSTEKTPCCFTMGGCGDGRPYPPLRTTPPDKLRDDLDPSLAFDVSEYGHLGYDAAKGPPDVNRPVQDQYRGTWSMWQPPNDDPRVGRMVARQVLDLARTPAPAEFVTPVDFGLVR